MLKLMQTGIRKMTTIADIPSCESLFTSMFALIQRTILSRILIAFLGNH